MKPKPFLKWAGGKSKLLPQLDPLFPTQIQNYYEPFLGGGSVFFHLWDRVNGTPFLSDVNHRLIECYRAVRSGNDLVLEYLSELKDNHSKEFYYLCRDRFNYSGMVGYTGSREELAALLVYLNKTCFNGLYRENSQGLFNVPMGRYKNPDICNVQTINSASVALKNAVLFDCRIQSYIRYVLSSAIPGDFVYFDPPYHPISKTSNFTGYNKNGFGEQDQRVVSDAFKDLSSRGVKAMVSNSDCELIRDLYDGFKIHRIQRPGTISSKGGKRGKVQELVITNY